MVFPDLDKAKEVWLAHLENLEKQPGATVDRQPYSLFALASWSIYVEVVAVVPHKHGWEVRTVRINMAAQMGAMARIDPPEETPAEGD